MAQYRRSEIVSGAFIVLAVVVFTLFAFGVGKSTLFSFMEGEKRHFVTLMPDIQTLQVGAKVAIGGRRVGTVTGIEFATRTGIDGFKDAFGANWDPFDQVAQAVKDRTGQDLYPENKPPKVLVRFEVDKDELGSDALAINGASARALLMQEGFLGPHYIQIHLGPEGEAQVGAKDIFGGDIKGGDADDPIALIGMETGLLNTLAAEAMPVLREAKTTLEKINQGLLTDENMATLSAAFKNLDGLLVDARKLVNERVAPLLDPAAPEGLHQLVLRPTNTLLVNANNILSELQTDLRTMVLQKVSRLLDQGQATLEVAQSTLETVQQSVNRMTPNLEATLANLEKGTRDLDVRLDKIQGQVDQVVAELMNVLRSTNGLLADVRPETLESLQSLRRLMWEAELAMRKIRADPSVVLFGDDEKVLSTWPTDPAGRRRTGRAAPYRQRDENEDK